MILVTGAMGFIGLQVARRLAVDSDVLLAHHRTRLPDDELAAAVGARVSTAQVDVTDPFSVNRAVVRHGVTGIVHLAVPPLGGFGPARETLANITGLTTVLEAAHTNEVGRVSLASSVAVYAGLPSGPYREDQPLPVASPTATCAMKKAEEILALHYADRTGLDVQVLRIGVVYGPRYRTVANLAGRLVHHAARGRLPDDRAPAWDATALPAALDLCYVDDCAEIVAGLHTAREPRHRVYNVGGGQAVTPAELVDAVAAAVPGAEVPAALRATPAAGVPEPYMDVSRARDELGLVAHRTLKDGIAEYATWLDDHEL